MRKNTSGTPRVPPTIFKSKLRSQAKTAKEEAEEEIYKASQAREKNRLKEAYTASLAAKKLLKEAEDEKFEEILSELRPELLKKLENELVDIIVKENNNKKRLRAIVAIIAVEKEGNEEEAMKKLELEIAEVKKEKAAYKKMQEIRNKTEKVKEEFLAAIKSLKESKGAESEKTRLLELINGRNLHDAVGQTPIKFDKKILIATPSTLAVSRQSVMDQKHFSSEEIREVHEAIDDFNDFLSNRKNKKSLSRQISLTYHPDKNKNLTSTKKLIFEMSNQLGSIIGIDQLLGVEKLTGQDNYRVLYARNGFAYVTEFQPDLSSSGEEKILLLDKDKYMSCDMLGNYDEIRDLKEQLLSVHTPNFGEATKAEIDKKGFDSFFSLNELIPADQIENPEEITKLKVDILQLIQAYIPELQDRYDLDQLTSNEVNELFLKLDKLKLSYQELSFVDQSFNEASTNFNKIKQEYTQTKEQLTVLCRHKENDFNVLVTEKDSEFMYIAKVLVGILEKPLMEERFNPENIEIFKQHKENNYQSLLSILSENTITEKDKPIFEDAINLCILILEEFQLPLLKSNYEKLEQQTIKMKRRFNQQQEELSQLKAELNA